MQRAISIHDLHICALRSSGHVQTGKSLVNSRLAEHTQKHTRLSQSETDDARLVRCSSACASICYVGDSCAFEQCSDV